MSFKPEYIAFIKALDEELSAFDPYTMVSMIGFGKVDAYSVNYKSLRDDLMLALQVFKSFNSNADLKKFDQITPPRPGRFIDEAALEIELDLLHEGLASAYLAAKEAPEAVFGEAWGRLDPSEKREFEDALARANIDRTAIAGQKRANVYVSAGFPSRLLRQVVPAIRIAGLAPVLPQQAIRKKLQEAEWQAVNARIASCTGGVISYIDPDDPAISAGAHEIDHQIAAMRQELSRASEEFPRRLLVIARADALNIAPETIKDKAVFSLKGAVMDLDERSRLIEIISSDTW